MTKTVPSSKLLTKERKVEHLLITKTSFANRSLIYGVGLNDANYLVVDLSTGKQIFCPYYKRWSGRLQRGYCPLLHKRRPTYIGCSVCPEWLVFSNFRKWMETQDWFGKELDKDLLSTGNKLYSPETCIFISTTVNNLLLQTRQDSSKAGVHKTYSRFKVERFHAQISIGGKAKGLGTFNTEIEAHTKYLEAKKAYIIELANLPENFYIKEMLLTKASLFQ